MNSLNGISRTEHGLSFSDWVRKRDAERGNLAAAVMDSVKDDPDKIAGVMKTAQAFGQLSGYVPGFSMVKQFQSDFEHEILRRHNQEILKNTPRLSLWLRNPEFAGLAKDDLRNLGWIEGAARGVWNTGVRAGNRLGQMYSQMEMDSAIIGLGRLDNFRDEEGNLSPQMQEFEKTLQERALRWAGRVDYFGRGGERNQKSYSARQYERLANRGGDKAGFWEAAGNYAGAAITNPVKFFTWALETAGESAPQLALAVATRNAGVI